MKEIQLSQGKVAQVDDADFEWLNQWKWHTVRINSVFYAKRNNRGTTTYMHREVIGSISGDIIDHKDRNGLNNQRENLRICTSSQNSINRKVPANNTSGYKGVALYGNRYRAYIKKDGKRTYLGIFENATDAAIAYNKEAVRLFGEFASVNNFNHLLG